MMIANLERNLSSGARTIRYGQVDERGIYGDTTGDEIQEPYEEGIGTVPLIDIEKMKN